MSANAARTFSEVSLEKWVAASNCLRTTDLPCAVRVSIRPESGPSSSTPRSSRSSPSLTFLVNLSSFQVSSPPNRPAFPSPSIESQPGRWPCFHADRPLSR